jgi:glyoxylate/hydroxypyruvate reductase
VGTRRRPVTVLVYHPDEASRYARLVRAPGRRLRVMTAATPREAAAVIADAEVLYGWKLPPALYARAARLRWVQGMGAGIDWALVPELPAGVTLTRASGVFGAWMAEYVVGWCAWVTQRMGVYRDAQRDRRWRADVVPERLAGKTLAVVGLGDIGRTIARSARALGMQTVGVTRTGRRVPGVDRVYGTTALPRVLGQADFVVLVVPLTSATRGLIGAAELRAMRPTAWLLNIARGPVVDDEALIAALDAEHLAGAILDVFATEPLPPDHPFWGRGDVVVTPHVAGPDVPEDVARVFNDNLARFLAGRRLRHTVDRSCGY